MDDAALRGLASAVREGRLSRRAFMGRMAALGLGAPLAAAALAEAGAAPAAAGEAYGPARAGGGGTLKLLFWQGPTLLNPHFATGTKEQEACRIFYEPLAAWDDDGRLAPVLAAAVPSRENGDVAADGRSVVWRLKPGVLWHDGRPVTSDDLLFTWRYARDPATAAASIGSYKDVTVEKLDALSVRVLFPHPTAFWADAFVGQAGSVIPEHLFAPYIGDRSRDAPANLSPVGTGPYVFEEFRPGDMLRGSRNPRYHVADRPAFDAIELKGGGDAVSAARAVLQAGEYDYAWNLQVEDEVLKRLEEGGKGRVDLVYGGNLEFVLLNAADPGEEVDGERASVKTRHWAFSDPAVRRAIELVIDRDSVARFIYGRTGRATGDTLNGPPAFVSGRPRAPFDVEEANRLLDAAGWARGPDGVRAKGGRRLHLVFQTSVNGPRQKTQAIIKAAAAKAGIELELKAVTPSVFFSSDVGNPDTATHFYADVEMYTLNATQPDPTTWMLQYASWEAAQKGNKWQGRNVSRWQSADYDALYREAAGELDAGKRAALFIRMNDLAVSGDVIPLVHRAKVSAAAKGLHAPLSGWDNDLWSLPHWWKEA